MVEPAYRPNHAANVGPPIIEILKNIKICACFGNFGLLHLAAMIFSYLIGNAAS